MVHGVDIYSDTSILCQAAIHSGYMTDVGGEVQFEFTEPQAEYVGLVRNGVNSEDAKGEGIPRGIKFNGDRATTCNYFKEIYDPAVIFDNWYVEDDS